eukprot:gene30597-16587_t
MSLRHFGGRLELVVFVNGRLVEHDGLYGSLLPKKSHPFVYVDLRLPPETVDVNAHPSKEKRKLAADDGGFGVAPERRGQDYDKFLVRTDSGLEAGALDRFVVPRGVMEAAGIRPAAPNASPGWASAAAPGGGCGDVDVVDADKAEKGGAGDEGGTPQRAAAAAAPPA